MGKRSLLSEQLTYVTHSLILTSLFAIYAEPRFTSAKEVILFQSLYRLVLKLFFIKWFLLDNTPCERQASHFPATFTAADNPKFQIRRNVNSDLLRATNPNSCILRCNVSLAEWVGEWFTTFPTESVTFIFNVQEAVQEGRHNIVSKRRKALTRRQKSHL